MDLPRALVESVAADGPPERARWLAELPRVVTELSDRWTLRIGPTYQPGGTTSWVAPALRGDERVVLKVTWRGSDRDESLHEADGLRVWAGAGTVRLLDRYRRDSTIALLLELCDPGAALSMLPEPDQDVVVCRLLRRLWVPASTGHPFRDLADMCAWWADEAAAKWTGDPGLAAEGLTLFRSLPRDAPATTLLVTDLHAGNVLAAEREPWLAIDPKPYVGDPHYDALQHMLNCTERLHADPLGVVARMASLLDLDPARLRLWLFARLVQESPGSPDLLGIARQIAP